MTRESLIRDAASEVALDFMVVSLQLKWYHWQTLSYARHKASDALIAAITEKADKLVEVLQGMAQLRVSFAADKFVSFPLRNLQDSDAATFLDHVRHTVLMGPALASLCREFSSIATIRDDLLAHFHKTRHLFSLA